MQSEYWQGVEAVTAELNKQGYTASSIGPHLSEGGKKRIWKVTSKINGVRVLIGQGKNIKACLNDAMAYLANN